MSPSEISQGQAIMIYQAIMLHGEKWTDVAARLGVSIQEAMEIYDAQSKQMELLHESLSDAEKHKANMILLDAMAMAKEGLERSRQPKVKTVSKTTMTKDGAITTEETHKEPHEAGDPRWLGQLLAAVKQYTDMNVRALPKQVEIDINSQQEIRLVGSMTDEELAQQAIVYDAIQAGIIEVVPRRISSSEPTTAVPKEIQAQP